jgi:hypothetical protein
MLFDDDDLQMANDCLKLICKTPDLLSLVSEQHLLRIFSLLDNDECSTEVHLIVTETLLSIAQLITMRKIIISSFSVLTKQALKISEFIESPFL